jgi:hypothetical protein
MANNQYTYHLDGLPLLVDYDIEKHEYHGRWQKYPEITSIRVNGFNCDLAEYLDDATFSLIYSELQDKVTKED